MRRRRPLLRTGVPIGLTVMVTAVFVVFAVLSNGFPVRKLDLHDSGIWVTNDDLGLFGRLNKAAASLDTYFSPPGEARQAYSLNVHQDGGSVVVRDIAGGRLVPVDVRAGVSLPDAAAAVAPASLVDLRAGSVAALEPEGGKVRAGRYEKDALVDVKVLDATAEAQGDVGAAPVGSEGVRGAVAVGTDGTVYAVSLAGRLMTLKQTGSGFGDPVYGEIGALTSVQVSAVGPGVVVYDPVAGVVRLPDGKDVRVTPDAAGRLQQPGPVASGVLIATSRELLSVSAAGEVQSLFGGGGGAPAAPVRLGSCVFGAWAGSPGVVARSCDGQPASKLSVDRTGSTLLRPVLRVNRGALAVNDTADGRVFDVDLQRSLDNWKDIQPKQQPNQTDKKSDVTPQNQDDAKPKAQPDRLGARPDRTTVLHVLDNDSDPMGGLLAIVAVTPPAGGATAAIAPDGQSVLVSLPAGAQSTSFKYTISNSKATADAEVTVVARGPSENEAPKARSIEAKRVRAVASFGTVSLPVLTQWRDFDGDPVTVVSAAVGQTPVPVTPDGRLEFTAGEARQTQELTLGYAVSDGVVKDPVPGEVAIRVMAVTAAEGVPPVAEPDAMRGTIGKPTLVSPLGNDIPGSDPLNPSARLRLAGNVPSPADVTVTTDLDTGRVTAVAAKAGTYFLDYTAAFGSAAFAQGRIRLDIAPAGDGGDVPTVLPDQAVVRGRTPVLVDVLGNDVDPAGRVLTVQSAVAADADQLQVAVLGGRWLRLMPASDALSPNPAVVHYQVTNGVSSAVRGDVSVTQLPALAPDPALVRDDYAVVRDGDSVLVQVLANDATQAGAPLTLRTTTEGMPAGQLRVLDPGKAAGTDQGDVGQAYVSGSAVRYVAPALVETPRQVLVEYTAMTEAGEPKSGLVHVTVNPQPTDRSPDQPPAPGDIDARVVSGDTVTIPVPTTGVDADGDTAVVVGVTSAPKLGRVLGTSPTGVTYQAYPNHGVAGTDTFEYVMVDRFGSTGTGTIRIGVVAPGQTQPPVAVNDVVTAKPGSVVKVNPMGNDLLAAGDKVTIAPLEQLNRPLPAGAKLDKDEGPVTVTAPAAEAPPVQIAYALKGNGGVGPSATITVSARAGHQNPPRIYDQAARVDGLVATADVLASAWDPDGESALLKVTKVGAGATLQGGTVSVPVTDRMQAVPYEVTDADGARSAAVVFVPMAGEGAPYVKAGGLIKVDRNASVTVSLADYVESTRGRQVRLTLLDRMSGSPDGLVTVSAEGDQRLVVTARNDYTGPAAVSLEVTDGETLADASGLKAFVTIPVQVGPPTPVLYCPSDAQNVMQGGQPLRLDIATLCHVWAPERSDVAVMKFTAEWAKPLASVSAEADHVVTVKAAGAAMPGQSGQLLVGVQGIPEVKKQPVVIGVLKAPSPQVVLRTINEVKQGTTVRQTLSMQSPLLDAVPTVVSIRQTSGMPVTTSHQGAEITLTPAGTSFGSMTFDVVAADLADATRTDRQVRGSFTMVVYGIPGAAPAPQPGQALQSHGATVTILPAPPNGAPIESYEVIWDYGRQDCGLVTTCQIAGLTNGKPVSFRVRARNKAGWGPESPASAPVVPDQRPGAVSGFVAANPRDRLLNLSWSALQVDGTPVTTYTITSSCGATQNVSAAATTVDVATSGNNTPCTFSIVGVNKAGPSTSAATTQGQSSGKPIWNGGLAVAPAQTAGATTAVTVSWAAVDPQGPGPVSYTVTRDGSPIAGCAGVATRCTDPSVTYDGATHTYVATATNATGGAAHQTSSAPTTWLATGQPDAWAAAPQLAANAVDNQATISGTAPAARGGGARLEVQGATYSPPAASATSAVGLSGVVTFPAGSNGQNRSFQLRVCNTKGCGPWQATSSTVPFGQMSLGAPSASVSGTVITGSVTANANGRRATLTLRDQLGNVWSQTSGTGALAITMATDVSFDQSRSFTATLQSDPTTPTRTLTMTSGPSTTVTTPPRPLPTIRIANANFASGTADLVFSNWGTRGESLLIRCWKQEQLTHPNGYLNGGGFGSEVSITNPANGSVRISCGASNTGDWFWFDVFNRCHTGNEISRSGEDRLLQYSC